MERTSSATSRSAHVGQQFPPQTRRQREVDLLLLIFSTVATRRTATYISTPLTSGQRAFEWHLQNGGEDAHLSPDFRERVIEPNRREAAAFADALREQVAGVVIDPAALPDVDGWDQADYRVFWGRVIEEYVRQVVFRSGWQYSSGCTYEYFVARRVGVEILDESLDLLPESSGIRLIDAAIVETRQRGSDATFLVRVLDALKAGDPQ